MPDNDTNQNKIVAISGEYTGKSFVDANGDELFTFVLTTRSLDRANEVVDTRTLKVDSFRANPRMYYMHNRFRSTTGEWRNLRMEGDKWLADAYFHCLPDIESGEPISERVKQYVKSGQLKTCSIGFSNSLETVIPVIDGAVHLPDGQVIIVPANRAARIADSWKRGVSFHQNAELLECSIVDLPANQDAVAKIEELSNMINTKIGKPISATNFKKIKMAITHADNCTKALHELADSIGENVDNEDEDEQDNPVSPNTDKPEDKPNKSLDEIILEIAEIKASISEINKNIEPLASDYRLRKLLEIHNI